MPTDRSGGLSPDEIVTRGFPTQFRGLSESEVRNFLKRVSDELAAAREHERQLTEQVAELNEQLRNPPPLSDSELLDRLGTETARVLQSAQEAATEIRTKSQERAGVLVEEAEERARVLHAEARDVLEARTEEAEAAAAEVRTRADADASAYRERSEAEAAELTATAEAEAAETIEAARVEGRSMVGEAKAVRERILTDLARKRSSLQHQVEELRTGRERLLEAYNTVQRTLAETTAALGGEAVVPAVGGELASTEWLDAPLDAPFGTPLEVAPDTPSEDAVTLESPAEAQAEPPAEGGTPALEQAADGEATAPAATGATPKVGSPKAVAPKSGPTKSGPTKAADEPKATGSKATGPKRTPPEAKVAEESGPVDIDLTDAEVAAPTPGNPASAESTPKGKAKPKAKGGLRKKVRYVFGVEPLDGDEPAPVAATTESLADAPDAGGDEGVDAVFARLRAGHGPDSDAAATELGSDVADSADVAGAADVAPVAPPGKVATGKGISGRATSGKAAVGATSAASANVTAPEEVVTDEPDADEEPAAPLSEDDALLAARDATLVPVQRSLLRAVKRLLQDEQNELLDAVRKHKGAPTSAVVLREEAEELTLWSAALARPIEQAFSAGAASVDGGVKVGAPSEDLGESGARVLTAELRAQLVDAVDRGDAEDLPTRVGARYREFRRQGLDDRLGDLLTTAWARGVFEATPEDRVLRWVPHASGTCPDCDDNALEPVPRGEPFPTGQLHPPAHPGCRCSIAPSGVS